MTQMNGLSPNKDEEKEPKGMGKVQKDKTSATEGNTHTQARPTAKDEEGRVEPDPNR